MAIAEPAPRLTLPEDGKGYALPQGHLSIAQVTAWLSCPACYEAKYVYGQMKRGVHFVIGSAVHRALEVARTGATSEDIADAARDAFVFGCDETEEGRPELPPLDDFEKYRSRGAAQDFAVRMARIATPRIVRDENALGGVSQAEAWIDFDSVFPFKFYGRLDVRLKDGRLRDIKTTGTDALPADSVLLQLATYLLPDRAEGRAAELEPAYNPLVDTVCIIKKDDRVEAAAFPVVTHPMVLTDEQIDGAYQQIMTVARAISSGIFPVGQGFFGRHEVDHRTPSYRRLSAS